MAAPTFEAAGTGSSGDSSCTPAYPSGIVAGSLLIIQVWCLDGDGAADAITTPSGGWSRIAYQDYGNGNAQVALFAKKATGSESGSVTVATGGATFEIDARMYRFAGWNDTGTIADAFEDITYSSFTSSNTIADQGVTTSGADRLACNFVFVEDDNALDAFTGETGGDWTEAVDEYTNTTSTDVALGLQIATMASAGTINGGTDTMAAIDNWAVIGLAILPSATGAVALTGKGAQSNAGRASSQLSLAVTGRGAATSAGRASASLALGLTGRGAVVNAGRGVVQVLASLTGAGANSNAGRASASLTASLAGRGANSTAGLGATQLSLALTGQGANTNAGRATATLAAALSGRGANSTAGTGALTVTSEGGVALTGKGANSNAGRAATQLALAFTGRGANSTAGRGTLSVASDSGEVDPCSLLTEDGQELLTESGTELFDETCVQDAPVAHVWQKGYRREELPTVRRLHIRLRLTILRKSIWSTPPLRIPLVTGRTARSHHRTRTTSRHTVTRSQVGNACRRTHMSGPVRVEQRLLRPKSYHRELMALAEHFL